MQSPRKRSASPETERFLEEKQSKIGKINRGQVLSSLYRTDLSLLPFPFFLSFLSFFFLFSPLNSLINFPTRDQRTRRRIFPARWRTFHRTKNHPRSQKISIRSSYVTQNSHCFRFCNRLSVTSLFLLSSKRFRDESFLFIVFIDRSWGGERAV